MIPVIKENYSPFPQTKIPEIEDEGCGPPPYVKTTEVGQEEALDELESVPEKKNGLLIGFAFEFNYSILASRNIKRALICDIDPKMHHLYQWLSTTLCSDISRKAFFDAFRIELSQEKYYNFPPNYIDEIISHFNKRETSWCFSDKSFKKIQSMYLEGRVTHACIDLWKDSAYFDSLSQWINDNGYTVDVVYTSNIPEWAQRSGTTKEMELNLMKIISKHTVYIDAKQEKFESGEPKLRLSGPGIQSIEDLPSNMPSRVRKRKTVENRSTIPFNL